MDIQQLRYFWVSSQTLNYAKAAEQLFLSRQALSKAIHALEKELGEPLFATHKGKLQLTFFGQQLLAQATPVIDSFSELERFIDDWTSQRKKQLRVAIGIGSLNALPPQLFADFQEKYPDICLTLDEYSDQKVREKVESGQVSIGILSCSSHSILNYDACLIQPGQIYLQVFKSHALAVKDHIEIADLQGQPFISLGEEYDMHNLFVEKCREAGFTPNLVMITQDSNAANNMVLRNQGISFGHIQTLSMAAHPSIRMIPLRLKGTDWGTYAIRNKGDSGTPATRILIDYLAQSSESGQSK